MSTPSDKNPLTTTVRYEVHRTREPGRNGQAQPPVTEVFHGLDRARLAALSFALDGPTIAGERFTGVVEIIQVLEGPRRHVRTLIDVIDERVASRLLNEVRLPRAEQLGVSVADLQRGIDGLLPS